MDYSFKHYGYCPICESAVMFVADNPWFRDHLICTICSSIPRERALMAVISQFYPNWRDLTIHESSPSHRGTSIKLRNECRNYTASHYYPIIERGMVNKESGIVCEDLENMTISDCSIDVFVTQDVMEHVFNPKAAFKEIARVLKTDGAHVFTAPLVNKIKTSQRAASIDEAGSIQYHFPAEYHGNPISGDGSLVTMRWGYDIVSHIAQWTNMPTMIIQIDDLDRGIRAEYLEVLSSFKTPKLDISTTL